MDENDPLRAKYANACNRMMSSLIDGYLTKDDEKANGLLFHATYSKPAKLGVFACGNAVFSCGVLCHGKGDSKSKVQKAGCHR